MRKLVLFIAALICAVVGAIAQTITVTSAAAAGPGTLNAAIAASLGAAEVRVINFQIPGVGPHIINPGNILLNAANTLTIEATAIQAGWSAAQSNIILRGSGTGNCFTVNRSNFTLRGLIIQNYVNGYVQLSGINNLIEGCWIGVNNTGTASSNNLTDDGIYVNGNAGNNKVTVDNCVISGCGKVGIHFNGAQAGSIVSNSFVGTDKTGTLPVQNGATLDAENFHGILIDNTPGVQIITNVISANASGGIDIRGANSGNSDIRGNKIGTDITGNKPLGNNTFGVRIKGSNGHTIGGASINDRNIISANGTDKYRFFAYSTGLPNEVDWYNSSGIYLGNSKNNKIINNYIGVKASGNSSKDVLDYDLGNFYCGIKIETGSANTIIKDNIVSGNGFRSFEAYAAITYPTNNGGETMKGHGILIKDATTSGNVLTGNYVGIGADGSTKIGNKQDGVSIQGATGTIIGGNSAALRNVLSGNTWGLTISSNYFNSQSSDIEVYGNYVGTDATGTLAVGNSEGGIGVTNYTKGTIIGSANPGDRNIISGNGSGISLLGKSPAIGTDGGKASEFAVVYGNYIGYGANGTTPIPNLGNGLIISEGSNNNIIGGPAAIFANKIGNNTGHGIYSNTGTTNTISGNIISNNTLSGVFLDAAINNTVSANQIYSNNSHGITLRSASNGNKFFNNIIGDLTVVANGNKGDGINITGSSNNIIGGVNAGEGNTIANNTANGIVMLGTSNNNSIHRNVISCNAARGIELNGVANGNYAAPTYSGSETALVVTGPAGSFIELYSLDGCNNCSGTDVNKLQGKTFITSGPSPLNYAGTSGVTYTATASAGNTTAAHKTSEFSDCYSLCTKPIINKTVSGSTVCQNVDGTVTINNPEPLRYDAKIGTLSVANGIGAGATL
ncbi:MAG: right-handed parallel beta-helix repeat-containing protein, partial [Bacteroidia bacterium]|nr:right-handed parallel beta-helix repeat-containing protein [Bacteroidia bacterium]